MWTLHVELWGSILIIILVFIHAKKPLWYPWINFVVLTVVGLHPLGLFVIGHLVACYKDNIDKPLLHSSWGSVIGLVVFALGVYLASVAEPPAVWRLAPLLDFSVFHQPFLELKDEVGAIGVFLAIFSNSAIQCLLQYKPFIWLGKMSFSIYLIHFPIMIALGSMYFIYVQFDTAAGLNMTITFIGGLVSTIGIAVFFERYVDRPAILLSRRISAHHQLVLCSPERLSNPSKLPLALRRHS
jgi:peptidoglycan/LPS O-acetylase OafA/YrhL